MAAWFTDANCVLTENAYKNAINDTTDWTQDGADTNDDATDETKPVDPDMPTAPGVECFKNEFYMYGGEGNCGAIWKAFDLSC